MTEICDNDSIAASILSSLDVTVNRVINEDREFVANFIKNIISNLPSNKENGIVVSFSHGGSAFEGLAVTDNVDSDITVLLGEPFEADNFHAERDDASKYFTLRWKSHLPKKLVCDCNGNVNASSIRSCLFKELGNAIRTFDMTGIEVKSKEGLAALAVDIERDHGRKLSIDFVPQIVFRSWDQCPDLLPLSEMPRALRQYIDKLNKNKSPTMCFALAVPKKERYANGDNLFNISFSLLEKEYFRKNTNVRDMVRLVKFVADRRGWKEDPLDFKSYFAKRVAIKNDEVLRTKTLWDGYLTLLGLIRNELNETGTFDGYFVDDQVTYKKDGDVIAAFIREIDAVMGMSASDIKALL